MQDSKEKLSINSKVKEIQLLEQNLQALLMQKQAYQMELYNVTGALEELSKSKDEVYKVIGQVMIRSSKEEMERELKKKSELLSLRIKTIEKQESSLSEKISSLKSEIISATK